MHDMPTNPESVDASVPAPGTSRPHPATRTSRGRRLPAVAARLAALLLAAPITAAPIVAAPGSAAASPPAVSIGDQFAQSFTEGVHPTEPPGGSVKLHI
jgi:hypothetical protein